MIKKITPAFVLFFHLFITLSGYAASPIQQDPTSMGELLAPLFVYNKNSGLPGVDSIYVINLNTRPDKWEKMQSLFNKHYLNPNRLAATDGWSLLHEKMDYLSGPYPVRLQACEYGRLISYLRALKDGYDRGFECIWICEDNVEFFDSVQKIPELIEELYDFDPNWDVFYPDIGQRYRVDEHIFRNLNITYDPRPDEELESYDYYKKKFRVSDTLMKIRSRAPFNSMFVSRRGMLRILHYFTHVFLWSPIDVNLHTIPNIRQYASKIDIVSRWTDKDQATSHPSSLSIEELTALFKKAQSFQEEKEYELALETFDERIALRGDQEEVFWSLYQTGLIQQLLDTDPEVFLTTFNNAYLYAPTRAEPLYRLANHYRTTDENNLAYLVANYALTLSEPESNYKEAWIYQWGLPLEFSLCAYYSGRPYEFQTACETMLDDPDFPYHIRQCVIDNLKLIGIILPPLDTN